MKVLTIIEQEKRIVNIDEFEIIEKKFNLKFPDILKDFILNYEGALIKETYYNGEASFKEVLYLLKQEGFASIESILEGHEYYKIKRFIPFGIDSGGWDYNFSLDSNTYGQVWVNRFDDGDENTMQLVATDFNDFIDSLTIG